MLRLVVILALAGCSANARADPAPPAKRLQTHGEACSKTPCAGDLVCCEGEYEIAFVRAKRCDGKGLACELASAPSSCLTKPECKRRMQRNRTKS
jgi:hypothetical protein